MIIMFIPVMVYVVAMFLYTMYLNGKEYAIALICTAIVFVVCGTVGNFQGRTNTKQEAVKAGAAEWVVTVDPITGDSKKKFKWINSKEDSDVKEEKEKEKE